MIRQAKKVEIITADKIKPIITINCEEALVGGGIKVTEKSELLKNQIDLFFDKDASR